MNKLQVQERMALREEERASELRKIDAIPQDEFERLENNRAQIQAEIEVTQVQLKKTSIKAPFSGLVGLRNMSLGAYVGPSQSIVELQQTNPLKLEFDIPEKYMREVSMGQKVSFEIVGFEKPFEATIYATSTDISPTTRSFKVRARCPNPNGMLKPGNFAKVEVITGTNSHAIMLPSDAVVPVIDGQKVFLAKSGKVEERLVTTGAREGIMIEIVSGINANDTVIVSGLLAIAAGMPIEIGEIVDYSIHLN
ncbi:MAG: efflux RND transporter periplasmic adaptor subunit [Saprospiraceae bacterium]|nr:efflux RND transporter periplasmic adaptor subunit [Saprospiraceae bacterium]